MSGREALVPSKMIPIPIPSTMSTATAMVQGTKRSLSTPDHLAKRPKLGIGARSPVKPSLQLRLEESSLRTPPASDDLLYPEHDLALKSLGQGQESEGVFLPSDAIESAALQMSSPFRTKSFKQYGHLATPTTSTVAASSSPAPAHEHLSSPLQRPFGKTQKNKSKLLPSRGSGVLPETEHLGSIEIPERITLLFGRHRSHPIGKLSSTSKPILSLIPGHMVNLLETSSDKAEVKIVGLSRKAAHASRVHAAVEKTEKGMRVVVIGQNGVRVRLPEPQGEKKKSKGEGKGKGIRITQGQKMDFNSAEVKDGLEIDFYGCSIKVFLPPAITSLPQVQTAITSPSVELGQIDEEEEEQVEESDLVDLEERRSRTLDKSDLLSPQSSLPPSSPPLNPLELDLKEDHDRDQDDEEEEQEAEDRSSPLSNIHSEEEPQPEVIFERNGLPPTEGEVKQKSRHSTVAPEPQVSETANLDLPLPEDVDLAALLVSAVVFSGSSKMSLPDLVKHMLESKPSLSEGRDESYWMHKAGEEVGRNPMFGKVERHGKDASGHPLLPHYFYNPDLDLDRERALTFGGLVRPLRSVQRGGGKAIDWRPVGGGRRR